MRYCVQMTVYTEVQWRSMHPNKRKKHRQQRACPCDLHSRTPSLLLFFSVAIITLRSGDWITEESILQMKMLLFFFVLNYFYCNGNDKYVVSECSVYFHHRFSQRSTTVVNALESISYCPIAKANTQHSTSFAQWQKTILNT